MTARLIVRRGPREGTVYELSEDVVTVGSGRNNTITILDNDVSTEHCRLTRLDEDYDIEDLDSRYGTFVNGQPVTDHWLLKHGAIIELGGQITIEYVSTVQHGVDDSHLPAGMPPEGSGEQPCLVLVDNAHIKAAYLLQSETIHLGRAVVNNDIIIQETDISRHHLRLHWQGDNYELEDLDSRNGTFVNGVAVKDTVKLQINDVIRLGSTVQLHYVQRKKLPEGWQPVSTGGNVSGNANDDKTLPTALGFASEVRLGTKELEESHEAGALEDHIFIAYSRDDWENIVAPIMLNLQDSNQKVWVDQHLRPNSKGWQRAVEQAHAECWLLIVVLSPESMENDHVREHYRYFFNREKPIILVEYKPIRRLPMNLTRLPRIEYNADNPGKMFRRLLYEIMHLKTQYLKDS